MRTDEQRRTTPAVGDQHGRGGPGDPDRPDRVGRAVMVRRDEVKVRSARRDKAIRHPPVGLMPTRVQPFFGRSTRMTRTSARTTSGRRADPRDGTARAGRMDDRDGLRRGSGTRRREPSCLGSGLPPMISRARSRPSGRGSSGPRPGGPRWSSSVTACGSSERRMGEGSIFTERSSRSSSRSIRPAPSRGRTSG